MKMRHKKSGRDYYVLSWCITNATNAQDGQQMVYYCGDKKDGTGTGHFVREINEFNDKFEKYD